MCVVTKESNPELYNALFSEDRIKEILDFKEDADYKKLSIEDILLIKEYITKLQQCYCNRTDCIGRIKDSKKYDSLQQRIDKAIKELFELKDMIYEPKTREINFDIQNKISSIIVKLGSDSK